MKKCVIIGEKLITPRCPLPDGACVWKHRTSGLCKYSTEFDGNPPDAKTIAKLVGEVIPSPQSIERITARIKSTFISKTGVLK